MGLTSLWSNITGSRVKEIQPQTQCSWLEKNRPQTSGSARTGKRVPHLDLKPDVDGQCRPTTSHDWERKKRSLSISRPRLLEESKKERKGSGSRMSGRVPDVPAIPAALSPHTNGPLEDIIRPGTAITTNGSTSTTERFELEAHGLPSPDFYSPSPSPMSPAFPTSPESHMTTASHDDLQSENGGALRRRSNSTASSKAKHKRASWFAAGRKTVSEAELPPPLPPPSMPPPPTPVVQPLIAELPATRPSFHRNESHDTVPETSISPATKNSLDGDSILDAFPSVPAPVSARESSIPDSVPPTSPGTTSTVSERRLSPPRARPIVVPTQTIDGLLDSKQVPLLPISAPALPKEKVSRKSLSFSEELQQEYDRLMEMMGEQPSPGAVMSVIGEFDFSSPKTAGTSPEKQKFLNDEALSKLEFGILT